jgi:hypothetical protein
MSRLTDTTAAMLHVLGEADGRAVPSQEMRERIADHGGHPKYLHDAAKALRKQGILVVARKARHLSDWTLTADEAEVAHWEDRVRRESLSEMTTQACALGFAQSPGAVRARSRIVGLAIVIGGELGMDVPTVMEMCTPHPEEALA